MKNLQTSILEVINHLASNHPELAPNIENIALRAQNKSFVDSNYFSRIFKDLLISSKAQLRQDLFVLSELNFKKNGFFVEFGAADGIEFSNTFLLESMFDWTGILAEPGINWQQSLLLNRGCSIDSRCVWKSSNEKILFNQTKDPVLSTIDSLSTSDIHAKSRENGEKYEVVTVSLEDLLDQNNSPQLIDYMSIDTEGSEYDILENFNFAKYTIKIITCEHNYTPMRDKLHKLLTSNGYVRKHEDISQFDDWYVKKII